MLIEIHPDNPDTRKINQVVETLRNGGVIIYPTDTVYGMGCDIYNARAVEKIARLKKMRVDKANFSFICKDLSHISDFTRHFNTPTYKLLKRNLPGPFTFLLPANNQIPKLFKNKKKTVGIRIPNHNIPLAIVEALGNPLLTTSIHDSDEIIDYTTDPDIIHDTFEKLVDIVISSGYGHNIPSTIVDCTNGEPVITREGLGVLI